MKRYVVNEIESGTILRTDKLGDPFELGIGRGEDLQTLLEMYRTFSPRPASQGLPPEDPETCKNWVKTLLKKGENTLAWREKRIIGHVSVIPDGPRKSGELVIFVHQNDQNRGVGTELMQFSLAELDRLGFELVWLTVRLLNFIAIKLYTKLGFEFCDTDSYERVMAIRLRSVPTNRVYTPR